LELEEKARRQGLRETEAEVREAEASRGRLETTLAALEHSLQGKREVLLSNPEP